jgi:hypothetical protein
MFITDSGSGEDFLNIAGNMPVDLLFDCGLIKLPESIGKRIHEPLLSCRHKELVKLHLTRRPRRL